MRINDVITSKGSSAVWTIKPGATIKELLSELSEHNVGALVVSEDGTTMVGIVSERDVVRKLHSVEDLRNQSVADIMTSDVQSCGPDDSLDSLMSLMTDRRIRHVPVLDADAGLVGVLSIGDAVKFRMEQLQFERDQLHEYVSGTQ